MKHLILFISVFFFTACSDRKSEPVAADISIQNRPGQEAGVIPSDAQIYNFARFKDRYSWQDVDNYYRYEVLQNEKDKNYFNGLKNLTFSVLVTVYNLPEQAPQATLAYYVDEQTAMRYTPFAKEYAQCLEMLRGYWPDQKIRQAASGRYEKTRQYYLTTAWAEKWETEKEKYAPLLAFH